MRPYSVVKEFAPGSIINGIIVRKTNDAVYVDIGYKSEGAIPIQEFRQDDQVKPVFLLVGFFLDAQRKPQFLPAAELVQELLDMLPKIAHLDVSSHHGFLQT